MSNRILVSVLGLFCSGGFCLSSVESFAAPVLVVDEATLYFSCPQGKRSEIDRFTVFNSMDSVDEIGSIRIVGPDRDVFIAEGSLSINLAQGLASEVGVLFAPPDGRVGPMVARCEVVGLDGKILATVNLRGLSAPGLEGKGEAPLSQIVETLELGIDIGWTSLGNHTKAELIGDEVKGQLFRKANSGVVTILPLARYSPDFLLPFGYYIAGTENPELVSIGTLAKATGTRFEQNCLFPSLISGVVDCDPGDAKFGFFTVSPSHVAYTEDELNVRLEPGHVAHAVRVYPVKAGSGDSVANRFLVCFEEAKNGDYQDYVFLVSNVVPVE